MSPSPFTSEKLARALLLLALTKLLDRIVIRRHRRAWMIECARRQSGSRLPWMVVYHLQNCTWRTSPMRRTRRWHISKSTSRGVCNGDVTLALGANAGRGHFDAQVQRLPCSKVFALSLPLSLSPSPQHGDEVGSSQRDHHRHSPALLGVCAGRALLLQHPPPCLGAQHSPQGAHRPIHFAGYYVCWGVTNTIEIPGWGFWNC